MRAARSAASEVNTYLDGRTQTQNLNHAFTQQDIDAAINEAAAGTMWTPAWCARW